MLIFTSAHAQADCPTDQARYRLRHDDGYTAGFLAKPPLPGYSEREVFFIQSKTSRQTYWFFVEEGNSGTYIYSTTDASKADWRPPGDDQMDLRKEPLDGMRIIFGSRGYALSNEGPHPLGGAPAYILIPDLPARLAMYGKPPEQPRLGFFDFDHCAAPGEPPG